MNVNFTKKPTADERRLASMVSGKAEELVYDFGSQSSDGHEWDNRTNILNTKTRLLAYIAELELGLPRGET